MRLQVLTVALALGVGPWTLAQTTSSSNSQQQLALPPAPRSPKSSAECDAYQKQIDDQMAQISQQHAACLDSFKADRQGDNDLICSRSECQSLHTLLYGDHKTAGEQQVASCQAEVQRYQARSAAQQQGIQTLGNAIGGLLAPTSSTPIDSQNDLANYEDQQKGQAVLGDDSANASSTDAAAASLMNSGVPDSGPSVQSQLDSAVDSAVAGNSSTPSSPMPTPPSTNSSADNSAALPAPTPGPLPNPDPSMYPPLTPGQYQVMNGARQVTEACLSILLACAFPPEGAVAAVGTALSVQNSMKDFVIGGVNIYAGTTDQTALGETTEQKLEGYGTLPAAAGTLISGNPQTGKNVNTIVNGLFSVGDLPAIAGGSALSTLEGIDATNSVVQGATALQNILPSQPPNGANAGVSPQPTPPNQATTGAQGSNNSPAPHPAPTPSPAPTPPN